MTCEGEYTWVDWEDEAQFLSSEQLLIRAGVVAVGIHNLSHSFSSGSGGTTINPPELNRLCYNCLAINCYMYTFDCFIYTSIYYQQQ